MDAMEIRKEIKKLVTEGCTTYANCERLVLLKKTLKYFEEDADAVSYTAEHDDWGEKPLTKDQVMRWVASMENADGTHGGKWTLEQTEQARKQRGIECDPLMFYAAMNMMYSDYCKVGEKVNAGSVDLYAYMAKAFLDDKDAKPNKLARYYHDIAEK